MTAQTYPSLYVCPGHIKLFLTELSNIFHPPQKLLLWKSLLIILI